MKLPFFRTLIIILLLAMFCIPSLPAKAAEREELEHQLAQIERQIAQFEEEIKINKTEQKKLLAKIKELKTDQAILRLKIRSTALAIDKLEKEITATAGAIERHQEKLANLRRQLTVIVRLLDRQDATLLYALFEDQGFSGFYAEIKNQATISIAINDLIKRVREVKHDLEGKKGELNEKQDDTEQLLSIQKIQQQTLGNRLSEESGIYQETKGQESAYQALLTDHKKRAAEIRNRIYELLGVGTQISFGEAVKIANWVSAQTGVRAAFLLAILTQESNLGKNVGTCNRPGDPPEKGWRQIMKPDRDQEPFKIITGELNKEPDITPVSCPMRDRKGQRVGWGGAMGPAQFIPSTWMGYKDKVAALTGLAANPWDIRDAFVAAGLKLRDGGATKGTTGEWNAAMRYFSGSTNPRFRFYGDNVAKLADKYQNDIDALQ